MSEKSNFGSWIFGEFEKRVKALAPGDKGDKAAQMLDAIEDPENEGDLRQDLTVEELKEVDEAILDAEGNPNNN